MLCGLAGVPLGSVSPSLAEVPAGAAYSRAISKEFAAAADRIMPSVVSIIPANSAAPTAAPQPSLTVPAPSPSTPGGQPQPSPTSEPQPPAGQGSGVVIDSKGHILTNAHVVGDADAVRIVFHDELSVSGKVVHRDVANDLALVAAAGRGSGLPASLATGEALRVGDWVLAAGNPFGLGFSISAGIVSATHRVLPGMGKGRWFVQTDAAINPGNSGGPLIDLEGRVVGISTAIYSRTGNFAGVGFVIPVERVTDFLRRALPEATGSSAGGGGSKLPQVSIGE